MSLVLGPVRYQVPCRKSIEYVAGSADVERACPFVVSGSEYRLAVAVRVWNAANCALLMTMNSVGRPAVPWSVPVIRVWSRRFAPILKNFPGRRLNVDW